MDMVDSRRRRPGVADTRIAALLEHVQAEALRALVDRVSVPRPYGSKANRDIRAWLDSELRKLGHAVTRQGAYDNLVATWPGGSPPEILVGAHYDSVAGSPGADDNGSAVAALLACAAILARLPSKPAVAFVLFNREEDGLLGSADFVASFLPKSGWALREVHVLEMVGMCSHAPGSQHYPTGLAWLGPSTGDFLALVANRSSNRIVKPVIDSSRTYQSELPIIGLRVHLGLERRIPALLRSDHVPFWQQHIPALMWTDTANFRSPHYHRASDTPDTLDYAFLTQVTRVLLLRCLSAHQGFAAPRGR
jgi:hypothetical protein